MDFQIEIYNYSLGSLAIWSNFQTCTEILLIFSVLSLFSPESNTWVYLGVFPFIIKFVIVEIIFLEFSSHEVIYL